MIHKKLTYVEFEVLTQLANKDIKPTYLLKNSLLMFLIQFGLVLH